VKHVEKMKFNELTCQVSLVILGITALYTLLYAGLTGLLLSASIGLLTAAFVDQVEVVSAITVIFALFYTLFLKRFLRRLEPFQNENNSIAIRGRLAKMTQNYHPEQQDLQDLRQEPTGVYVPSVEGFEDVQPESKKDGASSTSGSAPTANTKNQIPDDEVAKVTSAITGTQKSDKETESEEFQSATNSLFKLGKMPSENAEGPKLDAGQTIMKAMSSLDPNTLSSMTTDTKKLLETQKSLMGMLQQMRPVLADGKELLQTFSGMFGGSGGPFKL